MMEETDSYILRKSKNTCSYTLQLKGPTNSQTYLIITQLITTFIQQIKNAFYDEGTNNLLFAAESVTNIEKHKKLNERQILNLIKCVSKQMEYLHKNNLAFYGIGLNDILIINNDIFLIANLKYLYNLDKERNLSFYCPISKPFFSSPELINIKYLPSKIDYRTCYYSLGALIVYYYLNINLPLEDEVKRETLLEPLAYTKLYWFLIRCLKENNKKRILLFI